MRCDQFMGLTKTGRAMVEVAQKEASGETYEGMFGNSYNLFRYRLPDGTLLLEKVQADPWSSGPVFFLALKRVKDGKWVKESLWSQKEIEEA